MDRKARRNMEKKLGITAYRKSLPLAKKMEIIRENIIEGHKKEGKKKEDVHAETHKQEIADLNKKVSDRAIQLMLKDGMDFYSATEKAKEEYGQKV